MYISEFLKHILPVLSTLMYVYLGIFKSLNLWALVINVWWSVLKRIRRVSVTYWLLDVLDCRRALRLSQNSSFIHIKRYKGKIIADWPVSVGKIFSNFVYTRNTVYYVHWSRNMLSKTEYSLIPLNDILSELCIQNYKLLNMLNHNVY